ncbi:NADH dehydrogenase (ubiquinone) complex I, assembly factor 6-like [Amphiura filiformis]|uniref:NADH dehydrogenase (ubiquinone) complex I, assembly factor 6-like n=1 Tax=Amphiura filiformis TaxID=82378 RepID=UPI003B224B4E
MAASIRSFLGRCSRNKSSFTSSVLAKYQSNVRFCVKSMSSNSQFCLELVRKQDYEHFLCTLFLPESAIASVLAIRAFNVEIATVRDVVSDHRLGQGRMVFWRESLNKIYSGSAPSQPVAMELSYAVHKHKLSKLWLSRILEERERMLDDRPFHTVEEIESYAENTSSSLLYLTLEALGIKDVNADHAASHIGRAQGLTTILRAIPYNAQYKRVNLPLDVMAKHGLSQTAVVRGSQDKPMRDVVYEIASQAHVHLSTARSFKKEVPSSALPVFLCTSPLSSYLKLLQKCDFDVFNPKMRKKDTLLPFKLWLQNKRKIY